MPLEVEISELLEKAELALHQKDFQGAAVLLHMVLERDPDNADALRYQRFVQTALRRVPPTGATAPQQLARARELHGSPVPEQRRTAPLGIVKRPPSIDPSALDEMMASARAAYTARDYSRCLDLTAQVLEKAPDHEEAQRYMRFAEVGLRSSSNPGEKLNRDARKTVQLAAFKILKPRKRRDG